MQPLGLRWRAQAQRPPRLAAYAHPVGQTDDDAETASRIVDTRETIMLAAEIKIERSVETVWAYFTTESNWSKWWGGALKSADWRTGSQLVWEVGGATAIKALVPRRKCQIGGPWMDTTFTFQPASGATLVKREDGPPKGGAQFTDGGASHLAGMRSSLSRLKERVELETENVPPTKKWWQLWK